MFGDQLAKNGAIKSMPMKKLWVGFFGWKVLERARFGSRNIILKPIYKHYIFHLRFPYDIVCAIQFDGENMVESWRRNR